MEYIFLISRVLFGGYFLWNAYNHFKNSDSLASYAASKKVPSPKMAVIGSGALLLIGGLGIVFGVFVGIAVLALLLFLVPVTYMMHDYWNETDPMARMNQKINFTKNAALIGGTLAYLFIVEPWPLSLM